MNANAPDIDHSIDRALSALRDAQPRHGLEGRILASLDHRAIAPQPKGFHLSARIALWTAASAAILAIAAMLILHRPGAPASTRTALQDGFAMTVPARTPASPQLRVPQVSSLRPGSESLQTSAEPTHRMAHRAVTTSPAMPAACAQPECPAHDGGVAVVMSGATTTPDDAQALADFHAPSHPAPPLPLTHEEKLFLHMLRYGNLTQIAELNPEVRAKQYADETAAFKAFFPDPPPLKQPGDNE